MEREISVGYVNGYVDASEMMNLIINQAIQKNGNNLLAVINDIIQGVHVQHHEINKLVDILDEQIENAGDIFDDCEEEFAQQMSIDEWLNTVFGDGQQFIVIKGGK